MLLPGRLRHTSLGDVLGTLHRAGASGTLELVEDRGPVHRIAFAEGQVVSVDVDGHAPSLAEVLRRDGLVKDDVLQRTLSRALAARRLHGQVLAESALLSETALEKALRKQLVLRLEVLESLRDARLSFRVAVRGRARAVRPLDAEEFLHGRGRARDRLGRDGIESPAPSGVRSYVDDTPAPPPPAPRASSMAPPRPGPWGVLGIAPGASLPEIRQAFRSLARKLHPDLHPCASELERVRLGRALAEVTAAYHTLVA